MAGQLTLLPRREKYMSEKHKYCWGCHHSTMDCIDKDKAMFRCDLEGTRVACEASTIRLLQFEETPKWCPINKHKEEEKKDKIIPIIY